MANAYPIGRAAGCDDPPPAALLAAITQFNRGEYFEQHETLEVLWRAEPGAVRELYQGILQIGVAFFQLRRLNYHGTVVMLTRGLRHLESCAPACQGVDVEALVAAATVVRAEVERLGGARLAEFDWRLAVTIRMRGANRAGESFDEY